MTQIHKLMDSFEINVGWKLVLLWLNVMLAANVAQSLDRFFGL